MATIRKRAWRTAGGEAREAWIVAFRDQHGARRHKQFERKKDADRWLLEARGQVERGTFSADSASITVAEAAEMWMARCERDELEPATLTQYRGHAVHHIVPFLGAVRLSRLSRPMVEKFVDDLLAAGRSRPLTKKILASVKAILKEAQRRGLCAQNVAIGVEVKLAARHRRKVQVPSKDEIRTLLDGATGRARALLVTAVFTGMRASELRGLIWRHIDFAQRVIHVRQRADVGGRIGPLKSESSRRDIPLSPMVLNALREWRMACPKTDIGLVFPGQRGRVAGYAGLYEAFGPLHRFRHFAASLWIDQRFSPKRIQTLMGHASIGQTFDTYGHLFPAEDDHAQFAAAELAVIG